MSPGFYRDFFITSILAETNAPSHFRKNAPDNQFCQLRPRFFISVVKINT